MHVFINSSVDEHLGCFHVLTIENSAAVNIGVHVFFKLCFSLNICPGMVLLDHMVVLYSVFKEISILLFSIVVAPIYILTNSVRGFPSLHILFRIYCL